MDSVKLVAQFELDDDGRPQATEFGGMRHYRVKLSIDGVPDGTYAVTYRLHETFTNPVREVREATTNFTESIQTYGDFTVEARVRSREGTQSIARDVVAALRETYRDSKDEPIREAIAELYKH